MLSRMAKVTRRFIGVSTVAEEDRSEAFDEEPHDPTLTQLDMAHYSPSPPPTMSEYLGQGHTTHHHAETNAPPFYHSVHSTQAEPLPNHSIPVTPQVHSSHMTPQFPSSNMTPLLPPPLPSSHLPPYSVPAAPLYVTQTEIINASNSPSENTQDARHNMPAPPEVTSGCSFKNLALMSSSQKDVVRQCKLHDHGKLCIKNNEHWKKNVRKKLKNLGRAYTMQNGKDVKAKQYKPVTVCCIFKCCQNYGINSQKRAFSEFWNMGDWNKQAQFLWDHINITKTSRKTANSSSRRVHTRQFYLPNLPDDKTRVCKSMFLAVLQISNGRLNYTLNQKIIAGADKVPKDKRGLNTPKNKTTEEALRVAEEYIHGLPYNQVYQEKKAKSSVLQGVTIKKTHAVYKQSCVETGKPIISIKVFRKLLPSVGKKVVLDDFLVREQHVSRTTNQYSDAFESEKSQNLTEICHISKESPVFSIKEAQPSVCTEISSIQKAPIVAETVPDADHQKVSQISNSIQARKSQLGKLSVRNKRKQLRNEGKSYIAPSGKVVWGKQFLPQYACCINKCHESIPVEQQEILFRKYWALGTWNLQTKFLWEHIEVKDTKTKSSKNVESRRVHTRVYYLSNFEGERKKICKTLFCSTLQISNGRLSRAINQKVINHTNVPQDKRGKNPPHNKTPEAETTYMIGQIRQLVQHQDGQLIKSSSCKLPLGMKMKKAHEMYITSCLQTGRKPLCYTVFSQTVHRELETSPDKSGTSDPI
ncbi:uncharacterized protein LOC121860146 isoform X1 [Homarus americanus]|uniref:uncharacterized protein LOC121860146 isoform X1 n=1 Tax=Homarus americanus TaxID=6706 RepID=UPI001C478B6E|nr:uncharacterized protein LOC121860146 isoform X1 [Homarus americanus]